MMNRKVVKIQIDNEIHQDDDDVDDQEKRKKLHGMECVCNVSASGVKNDRNPSSSCTRVLGRNMPIKT